MIVELTRPEWGGRTLVFDTDDVVSLVQHCEVKTVSEDDEVFVRRELTGEKTLTLHFADPKCYRWEKTA